ncbi:motility-associated protein [Planctomicrobium piriforme]|uniref:Chemotaxis protein MotA n=1 Tax=Planctomicrobium piriforme TaxID=1576369 RepID=A0A1I3BAA4_9PLAN|nr:motility-associated protein [Planctomicrobium piriforme]SFH59235.1 chemotaxis protein MotA [Planctomicrobium piriforme]
MFVCIGIAVVLGATLTGFSMAGGHVHSLIHPSEIVTIGGAALGALIASSPTKVLKDIMHGLIALLKGGNSDKKTYTEVFQVLYHFFRIGRRDGLLAWESLLSESSDTVFGKYPRVAKDHHLVEFISGALTAASEGIEANQLQEMLETEIRVMDEEHHAVTGALSRTADALPGFGIVAAVLGIVITMQAIDGPVEEIGHKVGAALVGTFLGILMSYGVLGPVVGRMESMGAEETTLRQTIAASIVGFVDGGTPKVVLDKARRGIPTGARPTVHEMEELYKEVEK